MRWGLVGFGSNGPDPKRSTFNARAENLTKSDLWRVPLHKRRCLVPSVPILAEVGLGPNWRDIK
jgi:putative SOS response-associated peptidase YedK